MRNRRVFLAALGALWVAFPGAALANPADEARDTVQAVVDSFVPDTH